MNAGEVPGTLHVDPSAPRPVIRVIAYGPDDFAEREDQKPEELPKYLGKWPVTWVDVVGMGDARTIEQIGQMFGIHRLALEDVVSAQQRPKAEQFGESQFIVLRAVSASGLLETEQICLLAGENFVVTFQERPGDCFDPIRERIRQARGRIRGARADYLVYALIDALIDAYFPVMERFGESLEGLEAEVLGDPQNDVITRIHDIKRDLVMLRRLIWPTREAVNLLCQDAAGFSEETRVYLRSCYDHTVQLMELVEAHREAGSDLTNLYLSVVSNRMNEVMRVLTVIATIFIPLTFIAGVYGMNFETGKSPLNMPELKWYWGYPLCLGIMAAVALALLVYFHRKGWLGSRGGSRGKGPSKGPPADCG